MPMFPYTVDEIDTNASNIIARINAKENVCSLASKRFMEP